MRKHHVGEFYENKEQKQQRYAETKEQRHQRYIANYESEKAIKYRENHREYYRNYHREYGQKLKRWAVDKLGRKCHDCGLVTEHDCIYDFHHLGEDSWSKLQHTNKVTTEKIKVLRKWEKEDYIPNDIILVCSNCHRLRNNGDKPEDL
jgi:hypothetical protein